MRPNRKLGIQVAGEGEEEVSGFIIGGGLFTWIQRPLA